MQLLLLLQQLKTDCYDVFRFNSEFEPDSSFLLPLLSKLLSFLETYVTEIAWIVGFNAKI